MTENIVMSLLEAFEQDEQLKKLDERLEDFNPFYVLKLDEHEIRHSNVLAWLLSPAENHGLGDIILRKLMDKLRRTNGVNEVPYQEKDFSDTVVEREWRNIDIVAISEKNKFVLVIENKIRSKEGQNQLAKYADDIEKLYPGYKTVFTYLTLAGETPSDERYLTLRHSEIYGILEEVTSSSPSLITNSKVRDFLTHYMNTLEVIAVDDNDIQKRCREIYRKHKRAIDLIVEHMEDTKFDPAVEEFVKQTGVLPGRIFKSRNKNEFWFLPQECFGACPKLKSGTWKSPYVVGAFFEMNQELNKIILRYEIGGPFETEGKRVALMKHLRDRNYKVNDKALNKNQGNSRIGLEGKTGFELWEDNEDLAQKLVNLYQKHSDMRKKLLADLRDFNGWNCEFM